jgi:hypothetical protein
MRERITEDTCDFLPQPVEKRNGRKVAAAPAIEKKNGSKPELRMARPLHRLTNERANRTPAAKVFMLEATA